MFALLLLVSCAALIGISDASENERIIGGTFANIRDFPYIVSVKYITQHICGGSLISSKHVVTAAHCTDKKLALFLSITAGTTNFEEGGQTIRVSKVLQHPHYSLKTLDYDVSVLVLKESLKFGPTIATITLASKQPEGGTMSTVAGWGFATRKGPVSKVLKKEDIPIVDWKKCKILHSKALWAPQVTERMICAGYIEGGGNVCKGDSGGPLVINGFLYGLTSWSLDCATSVYPAVFSNVVALKDFIQSALKTV